LSEFFDYVGGCEVIHSTCTDPDFLAINVLDTSSKHKILQNLNQIPIELQNLIIDSIDVDATTTQKVNLKNYLTEFSSRRNLSLDIFPTSFRQWLND
jgi:hypothetical protein